MTGERPGSFAQEPADAPRVKVIFYLLGFALNVTFAVYLTLVHIFGERFSRSVLAWQNVSIFAASSAVVVVQILCDEYFDRRFGSTRTTYPARIVLGIAVMAVIVCCAPLASRVELVYLMGALIGVCEGSALTAAQQLAAVVSGEMTRYVNTGFTFAQVVPIALSVALEFKHCHVGQDCAVKTAVYVGVPAVTMLFGGLAFLRAVAAGQLDGAFAVLDLRSEEEASLTGKPAQLALTREVIAAGSFQFLTQGLSMALMPFLPFLGPLELAHDLVLVRFTGELFGRLGAHATSDRLPGTALSVLLAATLVVRGGMLAVLILGAYSRPLDPGTARWYVGGFYALGGWASSEVMAVFVASSVSSGAIAGRARLICLLGFAAQLVALAATVPFVEAKLAAPGFPILGQ